jgi:hypothetical protein
VWIPKYRKAVLTGEVAVRVRDLLRPIAAEHELEIVSGKVARDPVTPVFVVSAEPAGEPDHARAEGNQLAGAVAGVSSLAQENSGVGISGPGDTWRSAPVRSPTR